MCNAIKIMHSGYVITLTERGKEHLLYILDSFTDSMDQVGIGTYSGNHANAPAYRFAKKLEKTLLEPAGVQKAEVGKS